ncbi:formin-G isoform X2 [Hypomesus transpacificus]|uniref:formin-G isoform X2 n=1 Tax=Hypomesus transpacificus TaxID=137520 RepID=UPI001F084CA0|nr:formin-G isoform X2 [Hypomesus transpacificus]
MLVGKGLRKKENVSLNLPQLSNEMQLILMNKVKNGELTIEDALDQAQRDREQLLLKQQSQSVEDQEVLQHNFSVRRHNRKWQKCILQIDFNTKMVCCIEKGIIKHQLSFECVKSCEDGAGARFSISFRGHQDYELEATSLCDKHKIVQFVNTIIYRNIYINPVEDTVQTHGQPLAPKSIREGQLLMHRGGLASFKWVKYEAQLRPGQLTLVPTIRRGVSDDSDVPSTAPLSIVIHLSDGDTSVEKQPSCDTFTLITHKNEHQFRVPVNEWVKSAQAVQTERDEWVLAIDNLCLEWKRKSLSKSMNEDRAAKQVYDSSGDTDERSTVSEAASNFSSDGCLLRSGGERDQSTPLALFGRRGSNTPQISASTSDAPSPSSTNPSYALPVSSSSRHTPTSPVDSNGLVPTSPGPVLIPTSPGPVLIPTSPGPVLIPTSPVRLLPSREAPPPPNIPLPPPLPSNLVFKPSSKRTKAFHWDIVSSDKIEKSFWIAGRASKIEITISRLHEEFATQDLGRIGGFEASNNQVHIMLNQKIAHNFNIFLKSFPVQPGELKDKLLIVNEDDGGLSDEHITSLRRYVPTLDDVEMYTSHKGPVSDLHIVDQYMMEICKIPYLSTQLDLLLTLRELPHSMKDMQPLINQKIQMCMQLLSSRSFVSVLEYLLAIGNYLNENAGKGKAKGFRLSSLTKVIASPPGYTCEMEILARAGPSVAPCLGALPTAWEREEVHLAACPCGAAHVAGTRLGNLFPRVDRI